MAETLSVGDAAARFEPADTLGIPLGTGQPAALLQALGERDDWKELRVYGALLLVGTATSCSRPPSAPRAGARPFPSSWAASAGS